MSDDGKPLTAPDPWTAVAHVTTYLPTGEKATVIEMRNTDGARWLGPFPVEMFDDDPMLQAQVDRFMERLL